MKDINTDISTVKISGMVWIPKPILSELQAEVIRKENTIRIKAGPYDDGPTLVESFRETDFFIGVPRGFYFRTASGSAPVEYDVVEGQRTFTKGVEPWNEMQESGVNTVIETLSSARVAGTILCAATGVGKTVMGLLAAAELGLPTMILVHKTSLLNQWIERIESDPEVLPGARVGVFRGKNEDFGDDYDIVVGMMQTLANRPEEHPVFSWPGLIIADECHRVSAPTLNSVIHKFKSSKKLGLTATPRRSDGAEQMFFDAIGPICWRGKAPMMRPLVRKIPTALRFDKKYPLWIEQQKIARDMRRNELIAGEMALARKKGRQILVLTRRLSQLLILKSLISRYSPDSTVGICSGSWYLNEEDALQAVTNPYQYQKYFKSKKHHGIDQSKIDKNIHKITDKNRVKPKRSTLSSEQFDIGKQADIILATYKAVEEGFDVKRLDTLFVASPIWDCEQATGRILRKDKNKNDPIVVHFVDENIPKYKKAWQACKKRYIDLGAPL